MKKYFIILLTFISFLIFNINVNAKNVVDVHIFYSSTCPHCKDAREFLYDRGRLLARRETL